MDEQNPLTKEELENAKGAKINLSVTAAIFTFVIGFSLLSEFLASGYVLGICLLVTAFLVKAIFGLDDYRFKDVKNCGNKNDTQVSNDLADPGNPANYITPGSPLYRDPYN